MSTCDERSLERLFRRLVWVVATTSGCGASVAIAPGDAAVDAPGAIDLPVAPDVSPVPDRPVGGDVLLVTDRGACDPVHTATGSGTFCPGETVTYPCGLPAVLQLDAGGAGIAQSVCQALCNLPTAMFGPPFCYLSTSPTGDRQLFCQTPCPGGRRPEGYVHPAPEGLEGPGQWFARLAALESASVDAFDRMVDELTLHRAPADLIERARRAVVEEQRHTTLTADLARAFGHEPCLLARPAAPARPLAEVARDNAIEGCVRETYGALVATWQAAHARDPRVAAVMEVISADETRHAALSWALHTWAGEHLDASARADLDRTLRDAVGALRGEVDGDVSDELIAVAGLPTREQQARLLDALAPSLVVPS